MDLEFDDIYELESDVYSKDTKTPQQVQDHLYNVVYNRNWKVYLNSIEWDGLWLRHDTPKEKEQKRLAAIEHQIKIEMETHPFKKFF
jgi:hypothetical protein